MPLPSPPSTPRIPYDRDGSIGFHFGDCEAYASVQDNSSVLRAWNCISGADYGRKGGGIFCYNGYSGVVFAVPHDITHAWIYYPGGALDGFDLWYSLNTTTGQDGTWTQVTGFSGTGQYTNPTPPYRSPGALSGAPIVGVRGMRVHFFTNYYGTYIGAQHYYGNRTTAAGLSFTAAALDLGDIARGSSAVGSFAIVNNDAVTAKGVTVGQEEQFDGSVGAAESAVTQPTPSLVAGYALSLDNVTFTRTVSVGDLAPGATSSTVYLRRIVASTATTGGYDGRLVALAQSHGPSNRAATGGFTGKSQWLPDNTPGTMHVYENVT